MMKPKSLLPNHGGKTFTKIFKNPLHGFYIIEWWHLCEFIENKNNKKSINFSLYHYQVFSKSPRGNRKL